MLFIKLRSLVQEGPPPVGWNSLVVIKNVPDTAAASTEVLKLMRRFGTVIKSLVVNSMVRGRLGPGPPVLS